MKLNELARQIHQNAKNKGFWDEEREMGTLLMLCVSELAEAMEADRRGKYANLESYEKESNYVSKYGFENKPSEIFERKIKDSFEDELADTIIRILDICGAKGIDIEKHIELKMEYNETRENKHGCKY